MPNSYSGKQSAPKANMESTMSTVAIIFLLSGYCTTEGIEKPGKSKTSACVSLCHLITKLIVLDRRIFKGMHKRKNCCVSSISEKCEEIATFDYDVQGRKHFGKKHID